MFILNKVKVWNYELSIYTGNNYQRKAQASDCLNAQFFLQLDLYDVSEQVICLILGKELWLWAQRPLLAANLPEAANQKTFYLNGEKGGIKGKGTWWRVCVKALYKMNNKYFELWTIW